MKDVENSLIENAKAGADNNAKISTLLSFLKRLEKASIFYTLAAHIEALMVLVTVPRQRWEIEFYPNGDIGVEVFHRTEGVLGAEKLEELFRDFGN